MLRAASHVACCIACCIACCMACWVLDDTLRAASHVASHLHVASRVASHVTVSEASLPSPSSSVFLSRVYFGTRFSCLKSILGQPSVERATFPVCCNVLQWASVSCSVLQCVVDCDMYAVTPRAARKGYALYVLPLSSALYTATHCNTLQHTATHSNTLQHTPTHSNAFQYTAARRGHALYVLPLSLVCCSGLLCTLQHTATHCNTPQHTPTHCNKTGSRPLFFDFGMGDVGRHARCFVTVCCSVLQCVAAVHERVTPLILRLGRRLSCVSLVTSISHVFESHI